MYTKKRSGLKTAPWGTPVWVGGRGLMNCDEMVVATLTLICLLLGNLEIMAWVGLVVKG